ncbi:MAG: hypothetical protein ACRC1J_05275 [Sandaracinobacteroides sp.]
MAGSPAARQGLLDADMATVGRWLRDGWQWWVGELAQMVPSRLRRLFGTRGVSIAVDPSGAPAELPARGSRAAFAFPADAALVRRLEVAAEGLSGRKLREAVEAEGERLLPMPMANVVVASRIVELRALDGVALVDVAALPLAAARTLGETLVRAGIAPGLVTLAGDERDAEALPPLDFRGAMRARGLLLPQSRTAERWWAAVGVLVMLNLAVVVWRDMASVRRLEAEVAQQQPAVAIAQRLQRRIARLDRLAAEAAGLRGNREPLALMAHLAELLPPAARLQRFVLEGDALRIGGYKPREANLVPLLRASPVFAEVRTAGSASLAAIPAGSPFDIQLRLAAAGPAR